MIKVKASLVLKADKELPTDIVFDIPESECNLDRWNDYIKERLFAVLNDRIKVEYELV